MELKITTGSSSKLPPVSRRDAIFHHLSPSQKSIKNKENSPSTKVRKRSQPILKTSDSVSLLHGICHLSKLLILILVQLQAITHIFGCFKGICSPLFPVSLERTRELFRSPHSVHPPIPGLLKSKLALSSLTWCPDSVWVVLLGPPCQRPQKESLSLPVWAPCL